MFLEKSLVCGLTFFFKTIKNIKFESKSNYIKFSKDLNQLYLIWGYIIWGQLFFPEVSKLMELCTGKTEINIDS